MTCFDRKNANFYYTPIKVYLFFVCVFYILYTRVVTQMNSIILKKLELLRTCVLLLLRLSLDAQPKLFLLRTLRTFGTIKKYFYYFVFCIKKNIIFVKIPSTMKKTFNYNPLFFGMPCRRGYQITGGFLIL